MCVCMYLCMYVCMYVYTYNYTCVVHIPLNPCKPLADITTEGQFKTYDKRIIYEPLIVPSNSPVAG